MQLLLRIWGIRVCAVSRICRLLVHLVTNIRVQKNLHSCDHPEMPQMCINCSFILEVAPLFSSILSKRHTDTMKILVS